MALFFGPGLLGQGQRFGRKLVVETLQRPRGGSQGGKRSVIQRRGLGREGPAIVGVAATPVLHLVTPQRGIVDQAIRLGHRIAEVGVLGNVRFDDTVDCVADRVELRDQLERSVADLLEQIGLAVRNVDFHVPPRLVYRRGVAGRAEILPGLHHLADDQILGLRADVEIPRIQPSAHRQAGDMLAGCELRVSGGSLRVEVDMFVIDRCLARVVAMRIAVPDAVGFIDEHVVHRDREIDAERGVPGAGIKIVGDAEGCGSRIARLQNVDARLAHPGKIEDAIAVAQVIAPFRPGPGLHHRFAAIFADADQPYRRRAGIAAILLHRRNLALARRVAELRMADHGRARPAGFRRRVERPFQYGAGPPGGYQRTQHEPAVLRLRAAVVEHDRRVRCHRHPTVRIGRGQDETLTLGHRHGFGAGPFAAAACRVARLGHGHVAGRVEREGPRYTVRVERRMIIGRGQEFEIEARLAR